MTDVIMPQMGESIAEGTVIKWYKQVGDTVERDEPLFEISTDKVDTEIPAPVAGVLSEIKVPEGETVPINTVVAVIGDSVAASPQASTSSGEAPMAPDSAAAPAAPPAAEPAAVASPIASQPAISGQRAMGGPRSSPLVRKMAREHGLDLASITGSGQGGRITKQDVEAYLAGGAASGSAPASSAASSPVPASPAPSSPAAAASAPDALPAAAPSGYTGRVTTEPMSKMRRSIAEHMVLSRRTSAHVTTVFEADVTRIVREREAHKVAYQRDEGVKLTYTPFFLRALLGSLKTFPLLNASLDGDKIVLHKEFNIGVAVALEGGLIVPVIHGADEKSFLGLARAIGDVALRARTRKLKPDDVQGGTFTMTNPGPFGGLFGTPIINQPQVAILGLGGIHKRPVVVNDAIAVRSMVYLALSFDHRLIDGALGDQFMADFKVRLESWDEKIL